MSETPETDAARMEGYGEFSGDWCPLERHDYKKSPEGEVVFAEVAEKLERERDEAMRERDDAREALKRLKKDLAAANKGAETNAKVNQNLCARLEEAQRERDEVMGKLDKSESVMKGAAEKVEELHKGLIRLIKERDQAREIARLAFYIIRGVDPKFVKLAYERSVYWRGNDQPIYFMQVEIKKWDKEQKEEAK